MGGAASGIPFGRAGGGEARDNRTSSKIALMLTMILIALPLRATDAMESISHFRQPGCYARGRSLRFGRRIPLVPFLDRLAGLVQLLELRLDPAEQRYEPVGIEVSQLSGHQ